MPAGTERMTAPQPPDCQGPTFHDAVPLDRLRGVSGTAREEPAGSAEKRGKEDLIAPDTCTDDLPYGGRRNRQVRSELCRHDVVERCESPR
jgi:hypothetical protein